MNKLIKNIKNRAYLSVLLPLLIAALMFIFTSCCTYSFTGSSVPKHLKTIAIPTASDRSGSGIPGLRENLTQQLINKFIDDNSLQVTNRTKANAVIECTITSVTDAPSIVSAGENVSQRRLTVNVHVVYKDLVKKVTVFDKNFSNYGDYEPGGAVNKREDAAKKAIDNITEDILLAVVSGW